MSNNAQDVDHSEVSGHLEVARVSEAADLFVQEFVFLLFVQQRFLRSRVELILSCGQIQKGIENDNKNDI
jgi:hypothetical protein